LNTNSKNPDRLNITKKAKNIVEKIDQHNFFKLDNNSISRSELFTLAMALGITTVPTKLENINPGGFVLESSIESSTKALMAALFIGKLPNLDMLDSLTNKDYVYNLAQEYANTGFEILDDYIENKKDTDLILDLLLELDDQYKKLMC